jgi:sugar-specific transcriptional regulator TrmB
MNGDMSAEECIQSLVALGYTGLEAEVYTFLVQESPATGYRIARAIGKPVANTYKAIEALERKGAVLVEEGASRMCRAVPPEELLGQLERGFLERRARAARVLAELRGAPGDDRVYQLRSREQVLERCRAMLGRCRHIALLDVFPLPLEDLRADLEAAAARGVQVLIKVYDPTTVAGAEVILNPNPQELLARYPGQWIILLVDGAEHLLAFLTQDGRAVHQAIWSGSAFLSWVMQTYVASEFIFCAFLESGDREAVEAARVAIRPYRGLYSAQLPGYQELLRRFGQSGPARGEVG